MMAVKSAIVSLTGRLAPWTHAMENLVNVIASITFKAVAATNVLTELSIYSAQVFTDANLAIVTLVELEDKFATKLRENANVTLE